jgi:hypothetical protein
MVVIEQITNQSLFQFMEIIKMKFQIQFQIQFMKVIDK